MALTQTSNFIAKFISAKGNKESIVNKQKIKAFLPKQSNINFVARFTVKK
mgnify:CR=1|tara:strand:- start:266 stop:415 length:150 start_codon:yes stop_codon:yes gene_type:complete